MKYCSKNIKTGITAGQKAAALEYDTREDTAPVIKALGKGALAEKIIQLARENDIPIREDPDLVEMLVQLDLDQEIPPELYGIVAEVFVFVYNLDRQKAT